MKGYALNKMCYSLNAAANREEYRRDEDAYLGKFRLTDEQRQAVKHRNVLELLHAEGTSITWRNFRVSSASTCSSSARSSAA